MFYMYILRSSDNLLYIGHTKNLEQRLQEHSAGSHGAKFVKDYGAFKLIYYEEFNTRAEAMKRERQIKRWTRAKKEALIAGNLKLLKIL